jgi:paraquat-inducible protein B
MAKRNNATVIGLFVLGGVALVVVAVLLWGSRRLFRESARYVCYFDGSVEGLDVGAPAKARGVTIGRVARIQLRYRQRRTDPRVPVFVDIDVKRLTDLGVERPNAEYIQDLISRGLRARLETQSLITGTLFVNFALYPNTPIRLSELDPQDGVPEIPTIPTELAQLGESVSTIVAKLEAIDFGALVKSIDRTTGNLNETLAEISTATRVYRNLGRHLDAGAQPILADLQSAIGDARKTLVGLDGAAGAAGRLVAPEAPLSVRLSEALDEVGRAASAVRDLADYLQRNPNSLLVGKSR